MEPAALLCDAPGCPGLRADAALLMETTKGQLCSACWKRLGYPPSPADAGPAQPFVPVAASRMTQEAALALERKRRK
jgi:hypothetical protein